MPPIRQALLQPTKWPSSVGTRCCCTPPAGVSTVEVGLDYISPAALDDAPYTAGASATDKMAVLSWNTLLLYPPGWSFNRRGRARLYLSGSTRRCPLYGRRFCNRQNGRPQLEHAAVVPRRLEFQP